MKPRRKANELTSVLLFTLTQCCRVCAASSRYKQWKEEVMKSLKVWPKFKTEEVQQTELRSGKKQREEETLFTKRKTASELCLFTSPHWSSSDSAAHPDAWGSITLMFSSNIYTQCGKQKHSGNWTEVQSSAAKVWETEHIISALKYPHFLRDYVFMKTQQLQTHEAQSFKGWIHTFIVGIKFILIYNLQQVYGPGSLFLSVFFYHTFNGYSSKNTESFFLDLTSLFVKKVELWQKPKNKRKMTQGQ